MSKWYEQAGLDGQNILCSRVRLARNFNEYVFPAKLPAEDGRELVKRVCASLEKLDFLDRYQVSLQNLEQMGDLDRRALRDRRILNSAVVERKAPMALALSEREDVSLVINGADHVRIQVMEAGLGLSEAYGIADAIDDEINARYPYAFDEKYGYLTSYPTNVGTGMRASVIVHLPSLSQGKKFPAMIQDMGRFGIKIRGVHGEGRENYGALYEIANQKTLGQTEQELLELVAQVAGQLSDQENQVRRHTLEHHRIVREDEAYKSYGVLRYARSLSMKEAMTYLSQLLAGISDGLLTMETPCSIYGLMMSIQPASLQKASDHPLGKEEIHMARADFLRRHLPELKV